MNVWASGPRGRSGAVDAGQPGRAKGTNFAAPLLSTVAILAQGTSWADAARQAFFRRSIPSASRLTQMAACTGAPCSGLPRACAAASSWLARAVVAAPAGPRSQRPASGPRRNSGVGQKTGGATRRRGRGSASPLEIESRLSAGREDEQHWPRIARRELAEKVLRGFEPQLLDSESRVLAVTP